MENNSERSAIFISHANPEDNDFVRWLGAKLTALGYEVWADVMRLRGGSDWAKELEDALHLRAAKVLVVCTPSGLKKRGVRNEIEMALNIANKLGDENFIIPLRLEKYEAPFRMAHLQYITSSVAGSKAISNYLNVWVTFLNFAKSKTDRPTFGLMPSESAHPDL